MFPGYCSKRMSLRASAHTGVAPSRDSLRSQSVSPLAPTLGELAAKPTERVKFALSAPFRGHLSHGERQGPHPSRACGRRASHLPQRGRLWETDCDRRESLEGATSADGLLAMTWLFGRPYIVYLLYKNTPGALAPGVRYGMTEWIIGSLTCSGTCRWPRRPSCRHP